MRARAPEGGRAAPSLWLLRLRGLLLVLAFTFGMPGLIAGNLLWFTGRWTDLAFVSLLCVMWIGQELFVHPERRRGQSARTHLLILASFVTTTGIAVAERIYGSALTRAPLWSAAGLALCALAIPLGLAARFTLGRFYVPQPTILPEQTLIRSGVYRYVRHPMYTAGLLWVLGLCLILRSLPGCAAGLLLVGLALRLRIREEEALLVEAFGDEYRSYQEQSWRLIPFIC